jgi:hypothetical protein
MSAVSRIIAILARHPVRRAVARAGRTSVFVLFADPYAIVTTPLAVWMVMESVGAVGRGRGATHPWTTAGVLGCTGCVVAMLAFIALVFGHLGITILHGWRASQTSQANGAA